MEHINVSDEQGNCYSYKKYDGRPYLPFMNGNVKDQLQMLEHFDFTEEDVFLCLFPKSGTHWLHNIITMLRTGSVKYTSEHGVMELDDVRRLDNLVRPRTFVTHMTYDILPSAIKRGVGKIVYVIRNPKDVFVSYMYFLQSLTQHIYVGNMDGFLRMFLSDEYGGCGIGGSWFTHTKEWHDGKTSNTALKVHTIRYEELKRDIYGEIEKLAQFLEVEYDNGLLRNTVKHAAFDRLKAEHETEAGATEKWVRMCENG